MPLSEFYRSVNGKNESSQKKSTDVSYIPNDEFVELVCEKGQIMMQGQSSKAKKTPVSSNFHFHTPKVQKKDAILDVPMSGMGLNQDDDMVSWLNYPLDDYCSDLLPEISSVTVNDPPLHNGLNVIDKSSSFNQSNKDPHSLTHNTRSSHLFSWPLNQVHNPDPMARSGVSEIGSSNNGKSKPHNVIHRDPVQVQGSSGNLKKVVQKQDSLRPYSSSTLLNFSHFSRPAAMAKANLENNEHPSLDSVNVGSNPFASKPLDEPHCVEKSTAFNGESSNVVLDVNSPATAKGGSQTVKSNDPVGASSSVCSGNSAERASYSKRKSNDMEDFECESQDVEDESLVTKTTGGSRAGTGSKRSRAAEVHNLSERRRRDRINEKMFALQELIPNCNKVDKASMLDEAIEYLKTLQLQVQIMSMGTGLCMPSMIFPAGMQHLHPHFSPMGIGMGMNYGMGMEMEMNRGPPTMFPFPPPPPPPPTTTTTTTTTTTQGSRHPPPVYGHPSQGMPMLFPQAPSIGIPINPLVQHIGAPSSVDPLQNKNTHVMSQICTQTQVGNNSLNQPTSVNKKDQRGLEVESSTAGVD